MVNCIFVSPMHSRNDSTKRPVAFLARVDKSNPKTRLDVSGAISRTRYSGRCARHLLSLQSHPLLINERGEEKTMPEKETLEQAHKDEQEGKSPSTQAGE